MERYVEIAKVNLKFNLFLHIIIAIMLCLTAPFIMGVKNLDPLKTAKVLDTYISLLGIVLLIPLFLPEQDKDIDDLVRSKKESILTVYIIRIIEVILSLVCIVFCFLIYLKGQNCIFDFGKYFYGTIADCIFLGGLGVLVYSVINNLPTAYMVPILYYIMCYGAGKKYLGKFYIFSMMGGSVEDKIYLFIAGVLMIAASIFIRSRRYLLVG